jgi:hypothetical protein
MLRTAFSEGGNVDRSPEQLTQLIERFEPSEGWVPLISVLEEAIRKVPHPRVAGLMFDLLERFPESEEEVHWTMIHFLEGMRGYEDAVVHSIQRTPSVGALKMVGRMMSAGMRKVGGTSLVEMLQKIADDWTQPRVLREDAKSYLTRYSQ